MTRVNGSLHRSRLVGDSIRVVMNASHLDDDLERRIDHQAWLMVNVSTEAEQKAAEAELRRLHAMRSPERVADMERAAGLR